MEPRDSSSPDLAISVGAVALAALRVGLSVVPPEEDGSKRPVTAWKRYQAEPPSEGILAGWYRGGHRSGVGFVCGRVSGNLECLEFDDPDTYRAFMEAAIATGLGDVVDRIAGGYSEATPSGGVHWLYRCPEISGNTKLARRPKRPEEMRDGNDRVKVLIETRGEGGYVITAPSSGRVHPSGNPYTLLRGHVATIATVSAADRRDLLELARAFDATIQERAPRQEGPLRAADAGRPGDDFNARAAWGDVLEPHGWTSVFERSGVTHWRRSGKDRGVSATTNFAGSDRLYVFTTSTDFDSERAYGKFAAYALLEHGGDHAAAARALAARGYGSRAARPHNLRNPHNDRSALYSEDNEDSADAARPWEEPIPLDQGERPPFPIEHLPTVLRSFAEALAVATQTPAALPALMILVALAAAAAKRFAVLVRDGWREPVNLYAVVALDSGNRKSAVAREAVVPLRHHEQSEAKRLASEVAEAENRRKIAEMALDKARKRGAAADPGSAEYWKSREEADRLTKELAEAHVPHAPRLLADDCTPERLAMLMAANGGRMAVLSPEGGIVEIMAGRFSKDGRTPNLDLFLKAHAGDDVAVDRVGRASEYLAAPALTLGLAVQRSVLGGMVMRPGFRGTGLLARFVYGVPDSFVGRRDTNPPPVSDDVRDAFHTLIAAVLAIPALVEEDGSSTPRDLRFDAAAQARYDRFHHCLEPRLGPDGDLGHVADWGAKLVGLVARIAGLFHVAQCETAADVRAWDIPVSLGTVEAAIAIAEQFLVPHALAAFAEMGADPAIEEARIVLTVLAGWDRDEFSRRDLYQNKLKRRFNKPHDLDRPLAILVEHGYLRPLLLPKRDDPRGRNASDHYAVNPRWSRSQNPRYSPKAERPPRLESAEDLEDVPASPLGDEELVP